MRAAVADLRLGKCQLLERVGRGGMAEVFLAQVAGPAGFQKRGGLLLDHGEAEERTARLGQA